MERGQMDGVERAQARSRRETPGERADLFRDLEAIDPIPEVVQRSSQAGHGAFGPWRFEAQPEQSPLGLHPRQPGCRDAEGPVDLRGHLASAGLAQEEAQQRRGLEVYRAQDRSCRRASMISVEESGRGFDFSRGYE